MILSMNGGALEKMLKPFRLGLGTSFGDGHQWISWIHLDDLTSLMTEAVENSSYSGFLNAVSPNPVRHRDFFSLLTKALSRPLWPSMPAPVVKLIMGEMGDELFLKSQNVSAGKAQRLGFRFEHSQLRETFESLLKRP